VRIRGFWNVTVEKWLPAYSGLMSLKIAFVMTRICLDDIQEDIREMGIEGWRRKAQDRDQWRRIAQEAKAHVGLQRQVMMMIMMKPKEKPLGRPRRR
jgi:hypothetical protein